MSNSIWIKFYKKGKLSKTITFSETEREIDSLSKKILEKGIKKGDRIIVQLVNSIETIVTYLTLKKLGLTAVPVNPEEPQDRLNFIISNCSPTALINGREIKKFNLSKKNNDLQNQEKITTIIYTSGTTGTPKGVCLGWKNWENNAKALIKHHGLNNSTTVATPLPLFHCNAHGFAMYSTFLSKSKLILFDKTSENFLDILNEEKVDIVSVVPAILQRNLDLKPNWKAHAAFKYFLTAAAPLRPDLLKLLIDKWNVKIVQGYGLSESTNFSCTLPVNLNKTDYKKIMFPYPSIGVTIPHIKIKIEGVNRQNEIGQILIQSKSNCIGYWGKELKGTKIVETGDLAYYKIYKGKRYFYIKGRTKELINRGGEKLYPLELESEIRFLGINIPLQIFSIEDNLMGEDVGLAVLENFDFEILNKIPKYRRPKVVYLIDKFFFTPTGKVQRSLIAGYCTAGNGRIIHKI